MNQNDIEKSLTPAAREALETSVKEYRHRILEEAQLRAVRLPGLNQEISVRDVLDGVDRVNQSRRQARAKRFELMFEIYSILGFLLTLVGGAFLFYGRTGFTLNISQQVALGLLMMGFLLALSPIFFRRWRAMVDASSTDVRDEPLDSSLLLLKKWQEVEGVLTTLARKLGESTARQPMSSLLKSLQAEGRLSEKDADVLTFLVRLRNDIVHETHRMDRGRITEALEMADSLLARLKRHQEPQ